MNLSKACDFSHLHVLEDAEFTHAHWAELDRVLASGTGGAAPVSTAEAATASADSEVADGSAPGPGPAAAGRY